MNYIKLLEKQAEDKNNRLIQYSIFIDGIVTHLNSSKFKGEEDGERLHHNHLQNILVITAKLDISTSTDIPPCTIEFLGGMILRDEGGMCGIENVGRVTLHTLVIDDDHDD